MFDRVRIGDAGGESYKVTELLQPHGQRCEKCTGISTYGLACHAWAVGARHVCVFSRARMSIHVIKHARRSLRTCMPWEVFGPRERVRQLTRAISVQSLYDPMHIGWLFYLSMGAVWVVHVHASWELRGILCRHWYAQQGMRKKILLAWLHAVKNMA